MVTVTADRAADMTCYKDRKSAAKPFRPLEASVGPRRFPESRSGGTTIVDRIYSLPPALFGPWDIHMKLQKKFHPVKLTD